MQRETALRWSWMDIFHVRRYKALCAAYGSLDAALDALSLEMLQAIGCSEETALRAMNRAEEFDPAAYERELTLRGIHFCSLEDDVYPERLRTLPDPPVFLYARGSMDMLRRPCIAVVGTRDMTEYGRSAVTAIIEPMVRSGVVTISGLAYGIDAEVARESMRFGGATVAVLGHGLGMIYPKVHRELADAILEGGGLLLSEFPLDTKPDLYTFPARNRIIAGVSLGTVVVEAAEKSGSLITAELALEYGRDVFAVPGRIDDVRSKGCHSLIARGCAKLVTSGTEVLTDLGIVEASEPSASQTFSSDVSEEVTVWTALSSLPQTIDDLVASVTLDPGTLSALLTVLELKSVARNIGGGRWVRA